jgi:hypothetical protein
MPARGEGAVGGIDFSHRLEPAADLGKQSHENMPGRR